MRLLILKSLIFCLLTTLTAAVMVSQFTISNKTVQAMIYNSTLEEFSSNNESTKKLLSQSIPFNGEVKSIYDFKKQSEETKVSELSFKLISPPEEAEIYIIRNGEEISKFREDTATIAVTNNSLIEIKTVGKFRPFAIELIKKPYNITFSNKFDKMRIQNRLNTVTRVFIN